MLRPRLILVPFVLAVPFGVMGLLGLRHVPSTLPRCVDASPVVDLASGPVDGLMVHRLEVANCGPVPLVIERIEIIGGADAFHLFGGSTAPSSNRVVLDVGEPLTVTVGFSPTASRGYEGELRLVGEGGPAVRVGLTGRGVVAPVAARRLLSASEPTMIRRVGRKLRSRIAPDI